MCESSTQARHQGHCHDYGHDYCYPYRHPLHCILPPYILREIQQNGTAEQQAWAQKTAAITADLQAQRELASRMPVVTNKAMGGKMRVVYDAGHGSTLPGQQVRAEGGPPSSDIAVNEAYDGAGATYDLYQDV